MKPPFFFTFNTRQRETKREWLAMFKSRKNVSQMNRISLLDIFENKDAIAMFRRRKYVSQLNRIFLISQEYPPES